MNTKSHKKLIEDYLASGGSQRIVKSLSNYSLSNYAKLRYEFGKIQNQKKAEESQKAKKTHTQERKTKTKTPFSDLIAEYPVSLHSVFRRRIELWLRACSWKVQLNKTSRRDPNRAFAIQLKIYNCFIEFDHCQKALKHYQEHKRIMPTMQSYDFTKMSELQLSRRRDNLRSSITRRRQTIEKQERNLPNVDDDNYQKKLHSVNLKKEKLQAKMDELLACEKLLKKWKMKN